MLFPWSVYPYMEVEEVQYQSAHHAEECLLIEPVSGICQPALDCFEIQTTSVKFLFTQRHYRILGQGKRSSHPVIRVRSGFFYEDRGGIDYLYSEIL